MFITKLARDKLKIQLGKAFSYEGAFLTFANDKISVVSEIIRLLYLLVFSNT